MRLPIPPYPTMATRTSGPVCDMRSFASLLLQRSIRTRARRMLGAATRGRAGTRPLQPLTDAGLYRSAESFRRRGGGAGRVGVPHPIRGSGWGSVSPPANVAAASVSGEVGDRAAHRAAVRRGRACPARTWATCRFEEIGRGRTPRHGPGRPRSRHTTPASRRQWRGGSRAPARGPRGRRRRCRTVRRIHGAGRASPASTDARTACRTEQCDTRHRRGGDMQLPPVAVKLPARRKTSRRARRAACHTETASPTPDAWCRLVAGLRGGDRARPLLVLPDDRLA